MLDRFSIFSVLEALETLHEQEIAGPWHDDADGYWRSHVLTGKIYVRVVVGEDGYTLLFPGPSEFLAISVFDGAVEAMAAADDYLRQAGITLLKLDYARGELVLQDPDPSLVYDKDFGDDRECVCGHPYYRHFDTYEDMSPVGCKYCCGDDCPNFRVKT